MFDIFMSVCIACFSIFMYISFVIKFLPFIIPNFLFMIFNFSIAFQGHETVV